MGGLDTDNDTRIAKAILEWPRVHVERVLLITPRACRTTILSIAEMRVLERSMMRLEILEMASRAAGIDHSGDAARKVNRPADR